MEYQFKVPCNKKKLIEIRDFINKVLENLGIPEIEKNSMVLAVDEVCANLMIHSHNCNPDESLELIVKTFKDKIIFEIIDSGIGFNIVEYQEPSIYDIIREKKKGGIGLMLVRRIMDEVKFEQGTHQNVYRLTKKCSC
jgi:serine/threonine-protein kinase RsbW